MILALTVQPESEDMTSSSDSRLQQQMFPLPRRLDLSVGELLDKFGKSSSRIGGSRDPCYV